MKKALYILFVLGFLLVIGEIGFRMTGKYRTYSEKTTGKYESDWGKISVNTHHIWTAGDIFNLDKGEFSYEYSINQLGFREQDLPIKDTTNNVVLVFGDSFIEGVGAPYDSTFPRFLEKLLVADYEKYKVYNFGVSGADAFYNWKIYERLAIIKPTHVLFSVNDGDITDVITRGGFERFSKDGETVMYLPGRWFHALYQYSHLVRFTMIELLGFNANLIRKKHLPKLEREARRTIADCLKISRQISDQHGTKFMVMTHPFPSSSCLQGTNDGEHLKIERALNNLPAVHLSKDITSIMQQTECESFSWPIDGHFNSKGYELMADVFYNAVNEKYPDFFTP